MKIRNLLLVVLAVGAAFAAGRWAASAPPPDAAPEPASESASESAPADAERWTCPMHPQVRLPEFGDCPICGMDLVPRRGGEGDDHPRRLAMSPAAVALAEVATAPATRREVTRPVRMVGTVSYDQTAVRRISAWVGGRLERMFVDAEGVPVARGDHLVSIYSPELLTAQEELLVARRELDGARDESSSLLAESTRRGYEVARDKLLLLGLTERQVDAIEARGTVDEHVMVTSPSSGVVIDKLVDEGAYVTTGTPLYRVADLSRVWVLLDAYEQDLPWVRFGQPVRLEVEAVPGRVVEGVVSLVDPIVGERTRTAKVRVQVDNARGLLKPGMFVRGVVFARLGPGGALVADDLAGKWVSPMHPEIVKDGPGTCDVCGMDLVPAEELGLVPEPLGGEQPLVIPRSAALVTGERAVVYVDVPDTERPTYEAREVVLGPRAGDDVIVVSGLDEGERVVVHGAFRIDSAMQIAGKPSMMSMPGDSTRPDDPGVAVFVDALGPVYDAALSLQHALSDDDAGAAREAFERLGARLDDDLPSAGLPAELRAVWDAERRRLRRAVGDARQAADIAALRAAFEHVSDAVLTLVDAIGHGRDAPLFEAHCPMAFDDRGASWLADEEAIANPYFGASMFRCGEIRERFEGPAPRGAVEPRPDDAHDHDHGAEDAR